MTKGIKFIIIFLIVVLSGFFFWKTTNRFLFPLRAAGEPVRCFFSKDTLDATAGDEINVNLFCNSDATKKLSLATASLKYPSDILEFVQKSDEYADTAVKNNNFKLTTQAQVQNDTTKGIVTITRLSTEKNDALPSGLFGWGTFVFRTKASLSEVPKPAVVTLNDDINAWEIVGPGFTFAPQLIEGNTVTINLSAGSGGGSGGGTTLSGLQATARFFPEESKAPVGGVFNVDLVLKSLNKDPNIPIAAWDVVIGVGEEVNIGDISEPKFSDSDAFAPDNTSSDSASITPTDTPPEPGCRKLFKDWDPTSHKLHLAYACISKDLPPVVVTRLALKGVKEGQGKLHIISSQITGLGSDGTQGEFNVDKNDGMYTIGEGGDSGTGNVTLNLALKFQGIVSKPARSESMKVRVGVTSGFLKAPLFSSGDFTPDEKGLWHGSVSLNAAAGEKYCLLVKGPLHLQKKICDPAPTETFPGTYVGTKGKITLKDGSQSFDLSGVYLLVGDLPDQDGVANSYDISLVRNLLDKTDADSVRVADLNRDGAVNAQDYSLVIAALSIRNDEQ